MKFSAAFPRPGAAAALLLIPLFSISHSFANSLIAGGYVPENRSLAVTPSYGGGLSPAHQATEVAVIEIDNNLPDYELVLDFTDRYGDNDIIAEVRLVGMDGTLGSGSMVPSGTVLNPGASPGQFIWRPGPQLVPTRGYQVRVMVTYKIPMAGAPIMRVSMPSAY